MATDWPARAWLRDGTLAMLVCVLVAPALEAQTAPSLPRGSLRIGPLAIRPTLAITDLGVDDNVFNEAIDPQRDTTMSTAPGLQLGMPLGGGFLTMSSQVVHRYYRRFASQRSLTSRHELSTELPFNRVAVRGSVTWMSTADRRGLEIDIRAHRQLFDYAGGADLFLSPKTALRFAAGQSSTGYRSDAVADGTNLREALNRRRTMTSASFRHNLTPLTTWVVESAWLDDRFEFSPSRNATGFQLSTGFDLRDPALITGSALVGYRRYEPSRADIDPLTGLTFSAATGMVVRGVTWVGVTANRDVDYAISDEEPYLLNTSVGMRVVQRVTERLELTGSAEWEQLASSGAAARVQLSRPASRLQGTTYRLGVGWVLPSGLRLGVEVSQSRRRSEGGGRDYDNLQAGTSIRYGL